MPEKTQKIIGWVLTGIIALANIAAGIFKNLHYLKQQQILSNRLYN